MSVDYEYFRLFHSIAKNSNISKAAEELHLSQPTVTKELRKLEEQLGLTLFVRHSKGVKLTPEGEYLFQRIEPAIQILVETEQETIRLKNLEIGVIHTSYNNAAAQHAFKNIIASFQEIYPNIAIQSSIIPRASLVDALNKGIVDIAFVARPGTAPIQSPYLGIPRHIGSGTVEMLEYSLGTFDDVFLAHKRLKHLSDKIIQIRDVAAHPIIYQRNMDMVSRTHYQNLLTQEHHNSAKDLIIDDMDAIFSILTISDYVALVSKLAADLLGEGADYIPLRIDVPMLSTQYLMHYSKSDKPCFAAMKLVEHILNYHAFTPEEIACSI